MSAEQDPQPSHAEADATQSTQLRRTTCNRDCPDACGIIAEVRAGRVTRLRGDAQHPYTQGFLCYRTNHFLERQYAADRVTQPLLRRAGKLEAVSWDVALDFCAAKLFEIRAAHGPSAVFHYRSGGSLGLLLALTDYFWQLWGPVTVKRGDICGGAGTAAQEQDFGVSDSSDPALLETSRNIILWGKNVVTSAPHLVPILKRARARGAKLTLIDPVAQPSAKLCDTVIQPRPGGDFALAMGVARSLFERDAIDPRLADYASNVSAFRALAFSRELADWCREADVAPQIAADLAGQYAQGPCAALVGWGLGRRANGGVTVRALDALTTISGNLGIAGGGVSFYFQRRAAFDTSFVSAAAPRSIPEPLFGPALLAAQDPPIRAVWVTAGNPVAMLPETETSVRALKALDLLVVCDSFLTDTAILADVVLPTPTLLEADDLVGSYGHHYVSSAEPVVPPPAEVKSDLEIVQLLARRFEDSQPGLAAALAGDARAWKERILSQRARDAGLDVDQLRTAAVKNPLAPSVAFTERRFNTASGKVELLTAGPAVGSPLTQTFPLRMMALSTPKSQSSQWVAPPALPLELTLHPDAAQGLHDGAIARLESELGSMRVRVRHDPAQRRDVALLPKGGHHSSGASANALLGAQLTDIGEGGVLYDQPVRLRPDGEDHAS